MIGGLDFARVMVDAVTPVLFRWKVDGNELRQSETETTVNGQGNMIPAVEIVPKPGGGDGYGGRLFRCLGAGAGR